MACAQLATQQILASGDPTALPPFFRQERLISDGVGVGAPAPSAAVLNVRLQLCTLDDSSLCRDSQLFYAHAPLGTTSAVHCS